MAGFNFFIITADKGLSNNGILGLGPPYASNGPSFIQALIDQDQLSEPVVSFQLTSLDEQSEIQIGYTNSSSYNGTLTVHQTVNSSTTDTWWTVNLTGAYYGTININSYDTKNAIVDTGTSLLTLSKTDYNVFTALVNNQTNNAFTCNDGGCTTEAGPCGAFAGQLSDIVIYIDGIAYTIPPSGYMMDDLNLVQCTILVGSLADSEGFWVLGDTFIRNYYASFNYTAFTVSLAPTAFPPTIQPYTPPSPNTPTGLSTGGIIIISVVAVAIAVAISLITICILKKKGKCCFRQRTPSETSDSLAQNLYY